MTLTRPTDARAKLAAGNNADLYEAMFASRGLGYRRTDYAFIGEDRPPPYYSNLTVLSEDRAEEVLLRLGELSARFDGRIVFKDSFSQFELGEHGFRMLFSASWIWREAGIHAAPDGWQRVQEPAELALWERAWKASGSPADVRMFNDAMLARPDVFFLGKRGTLEYEAGCIANVSSECIGISNVYSRSSSKTAFAEASAAVAAVNANLPIVGFESGEDLALARQSGFEVLGDLRILAADAARF